MALRYIPLLTEDAIPQEEKNEANTKRAELRDGERAPRISSVTINDITTASRPMIPFLVESRLNLVSIINSES